MLFGVCLGSGLTFCVVFFFKQKTAYEMRISDWSSDVCSSDLQVHQRRFAGAGAADEPDFLAGADGQRQVVDDAAFLAVMEADVLEEIGRASCRERVCQYV